MSDEPRLPSCYIIGGPEDGKKGVDQGGGEIAHLPVEPTDKFRHFYAYNAAESTDEEIIYQYVQPNVVAAILKHGR